MLRATRLFAIIIGLALLLALPLSVASPATWIESPVRQRQIGYLVATLGWGLLCGGLALRRLSAVERRNTLLLPLMIVVFAAGLRASLLSQPPSDDLYRYVWEGRVRLAGFNPYVLPPNDAALAPLRDRIWTNVNHPEHAAIYPPGAQLVFVGLATLGPTVPVFKLAATIGDLLAGILLMLWLRRRGEDGALAAAYLLSPLVLDAFALEGHLDAFMLVPLAGLLWCADGEGRLCLRTIIVGSALLGAAIALKWVALLISPWWLVRCLRGRAFPGAISAAVVAGLAMSVLIIAPALFYLDHGWRPIVDPLMYFGREFTNLDYLRQRLAVYLAPGRVAELCRAAVVLVALGVAFLRLRGPLATLWVFGALLLFAPTVHRWYLTWLLLPLAGLRGGSAWAASWPWLVLPATMVFSLEGERVRELGGAWALPAWAAPAVFTPLLAALGANLIVLGVSRLRRVRRASP